MEETKTHPVNGTLPRLSELRKTAQQMGFVFLDGHLHNVIIDEDAPTMTTAHDQPQEDPHNGNGHDYIKPDIYDSIKKAVLAGMNPVIFGPAGSGKSRLCKELAHDIGKPFHTMSFSGGLRYSQVFGSQTLEEGSTTWKPAPLLEWIQDPALILLDEIFSADPEILLGLNSLLEPDTRNITTPAGVFKVNPETSFIACSNSNGRQQARQYTGTTRTDDSLLDRLIPPFFMDYDPKAEKQIIKALVDHTTIQEELNFQRRMKYVSIDGGPPVRRDTPAHANDHGDPPQLPPELLQILEEIAGGRPPAPRMKTQPRPHAQNQTQGQLFNEE